MYLNEASGIRQFSGRERLSPSAQLLLLYHLQKTSLKGLAFKDMAEILSDSKKTISVVRKNFKRCPSVRWNPWRNVIRYCILRRKGVNYVGQGVGSDGFSRVEVWYTGKTCYRIICFILRHGFGSLYLYTDSSQTSLVIDVNRDILISGRDILLFGKNTL